MPVLRENDFEKMAERVVHRYLSGEAKLADAAAMEATTSGLNPDQIERLVQSANTMTFLRMMDQRKAEGAPDLMHEFDPIDSRQVVQKIVGDAPGGMPQAAPTGGPGMMPAPAHAGPPMDGELPDQMSAERKNPAEGAPGHEDSPAVMDCEETCHEKRDPPGVETEKADKKAPPFAKKKKKKDGEDEDDDEKPETPKQAAARLLRTRKLAGILEDEYRQAELTFEDTFAQLATRFKRAHSPASFAAFEKDAMVEHGDAMGATVLNLLRAERGLAPLEQPEFTKAAALADRHISEATPELHLFETLVKVAADAARLQTGVEWLKAQCA